MNLPPYIIRVTTHDVPLPLTNEQRMARFNTLFWGDLNERNPQFARPRKGRMVMDPPDPMDTLDSDGNPLGYEQLSQGY